MIQTIQKLITYIKNRPFLIIYLNKANDKHFKENIRFQHYSTQGDLDLNNEPLNWIRRDETNRTSITDSKLLIVINYDLIILHTPSYFCTLKNNAITPTNTYSSNRGIQHVNKSPGFTLVGCLEVAVWLI